MRHVVVMSFTASVGLMAIFVVDLVDMIFISMLGNAALAAAIGYAGAILFFTTSLGIGMSVAAGALVAQSIGAGDQTAAQQRSTTAMLLGVLFGFLFALLVWANIPFLVALVGASGETLSLATLYLRIIIPSLPLLVIGMIGSAILRAHGDATRSMLVTVSGGVVNAILDPILIFGLDMGLSGAAWASVGARCAIAFMALWPIFRHYGGLKWPTQSALLSVLRPLMAIAAPAILTQLATPINAAYITYSMAKYGQDAVAAMAIIGRITPVAFCMIFALSGAVGPIIGQNLGAHLHKRVAGAYQNSVLFTAVMVALVSVLLFALRAPIAFIFEAQGPTKGLLHLFLGPLALLFFFNGLIFVSNAAFNNLGHPYYSTWINWARNTLGTIPFVILFGYWYGAEGILIGNAVGGIIFGLLAAVLALRVIRKTEKTAIVKQEMNAFERQKRLHLLCHQRR